MKQLINIFIYLIGIIVSFLVFAITKTSLDYIGLLSQGAILATFGSALITVADILERDKLERVKQNNKIFYESIKKETQWTRWSFLRRKSFEKLLDDQSIKMNLDNPKIEFDVGSHLIYIELPTVLEDFFDLPIFKDLIKMFKYQKQFKTKWNRDNNAEKSASQNGNNVYNLLFSFLCTYDSIKSACIFRFARLLKHLSIAIILGSILMVILCINKPSIVGCINQNHTKQEIKMDNKIQTPTVNSNNKFINKANENK